MPGRKSRKSPFSALRANLQTVPANVATLEYDPATGAFKATFHPPAPILAPPAPVAAAPVVEPAKPVQLVEGTPFPDDDSSINPLDLVLHPPAIDLSIPADEAN